MIRICKLNVTQLKTIFAVLLISALWSQTAMGVSNSMATVNDLTAGATTTYTFSFTTTSALDNTDIVSDGMVFQTDNGGPDFSGVSLVSLSGGTLTGTITAQSTSSFTITLNGTGSAAAGSTITVIVSGVLNPGTAGQGPNYLIRTAEFSTFPPAPTLLEESFAGSIYTSSNTPVVINPIDNQNLEERDGPQIIAADLNSVFEDGDGDSMTFSVLAGHDTTVTQVAINGNQLSLSPTGGGSTTVTIRAVSNDGSTTDQFDVNVIGELVNSAVTPDDLDTGATANYSISFMPDTTLEPGQIVVLNSTTSGPDYTNANFDSISGGSGLTAQFFQSPTNQGISIEITGGSASSANTIVIEISGVINPGSAGTGPDYELSVFRLLPTLTQLAQGTVVGSEFDAVGGPTITSPIANQNLNEALGESFVVNDLNSVFSDGNGDTLNFSIVAGHDTNVVDVAINSSQLTVTPTGPGVTSVSIKASDLPGGEGEVTDSFQVTVIGLMENASFSPQSFDSGVTSSYELNFDTSSDFGADFAIIISNDLAGGPDYSAATVLSLTADGAALSTNITGQSTESISIEVTAGTASVNDNISLIINGVTNPVTGGAGPDYFVRLFSIAPPTGDVEQVSLSGHVFIFGDLIFSNGFEATTVNANLMAESIVMSINNDHSWLPQPIYNMNLEQYQFMGQWLSRDSGSLPRPADEVIDWFVAVLRKNQPWDDWDSDGVDNLTDEQPFNYEKH